MIEIQHDAFGDVLNSEKPVLVDFYATWCGPCKILAKGLDEVEAEGDERYTIAKVDIEANPEIAQHYGIMSVPTLLVVKDREVIARATGMKPAPAIKEFIEEYL